MIANVENVISWLENNKQEYFTVFSKSGDNAKVFERREDETFQDAINRFKEVMSLTYGNRFIIVAKDDPKKTRGGFTDEFKNNPDGNMPQNNAQNIISGMPAVGTVTMDELERRLTAEREKLQNQWELQQLKEELKDVKDELSASNSELAKAAKKIQPYIGQIMGAIMGRIIPANTQVGVAGIIPAVDDNENNEPMKKENLKEITEDQLQEALSNWAEVDPDFARIIVLISELATSNQTFNAGFISLNYNIIKDMLVKSDLWK